MSKLTDQVLQILKELRTLDPVRHCNVYKTVGCAHVDGLLCNVRSCTITAAIKITPRDMSEVSQ